MSNITGSSISGTVVANLAEAVTVINPPNNKVITPAILQQFMKTIPVTIGSLNANDAILKNITAESISGNVVATDAEAVAGSSTNKVITPASLKTVISAGLPIGTTTPSSGKFSDLYITNSFNLVGDVVLPVEGGTGFGSYVRGDFLAADTKQQLVKIPIGKNGQYSTTSEYPIVARPGQLLLNFATLYHTSSMSQAENISFTRALIRS
jgi:hypothetical protein